MAISLSKYIRITSGIGGGAGVKERELILRIFTPHAKVSPDSILEFESPQDVSDYFGANSEEYRRCIKYFGYVSANLSQPSKISFARDQFEAAPPLTIGAASSFQLAKIKPLIGTIKGDADKLVFETASLSFANTASLADVAVEIQAKLNAIEDIETLAVCTVEFDPLSQSFIVVGGTNEALSISFAEGDITDALGLSTANVIRGIANPLTEAESVAQADDISNNYGTFLFIRELELDELVVLAEDNAAKNVMFMLLAGVTLPKAQEYYERLKTIGSVGVTLVDKNNTEFDEQIPAAIMAATRYTNRNSTVNYMFKSVSGVTPKVTTTVESNRLDNIRINHYGRTQTGGQNLEFYQRGILMGDASSLPADMNVHANEQWLKDKCAASIMSLLLSVGKVPANTTGTAQILTVLQSAIEAALFNGVISVGKELSTVQKIFVSSLTGDELAWIQVQNIGYWVDARMESIATKDGRTEWQCVYTLIYSKDDAIRKVIGTHILE